MIPGPVVVDVAGTELTAAERERLAHPLVGMVLLFSRNYRDGGQLRRLCAQIHALREPPLLIAVDHEGGRVQRFRAGFTPIPPMAALGRLWDADVLVACRAARAAGIVMGAELRDHGIDLTFAPVLDLDWSRSSVVGDRALHADPRVVALLAGHLLHGLALAGVAGCGKHFPGHGWARADTHRSAASDPRGLDEILARDAAPYAWLGSALDAVMPAHVVYPAVDERPAGFSPRWLREILRGRLGFTGAVFSDDLSMEGARLAGDATAAAQAALDAGCDFALVCNDPPAADRVLDALRWRPGDAYAQRRARLAARAGGAARGEGMHTAQALQALQELQPLLQLQGQGEAGGSGHPRPV